MCERFEVILQNGEKVVVWETDECYVEIETASILEKGGWDYD